ncbi:MAG TPA: hydroxyisourate hydrolase [Streptosporangiaceae bacterium]
MTVSTHVLDAGTGRPAAGVWVLLERETPGSEGIWSRVEPEQTDTEQTDTEQTDTGRTDADGRLRLSGSFDPGVYRITFGTGDYFAAHGVKTFYPRVEVTFEVTSAAEHYHVPLLLSPFAYSTYRGS